MKLRLYLIACLLFNSLVFSQQYHNTVGNIEVSTNGQLKFILPIKTPPSVKNINPEITLEYNSSNISRSVAGYGFTLSGLSSISRIPKNLEKDSENKAIQLNNTDYYQFNGQKLLLKTGTGQYGDNGTEYYTEQYSNLKIKSVGSITTQNYTGPEYFEVTYPNGTQAWYGKDANSRNPLEYNICKWIDIKGNYISYNYSAYTEYNPIGYNRYLAENYGIVSKLISIEWGGNEILNKPHFNKISFEYSNFNFRSSVLIAGSLMTQNEHRLDNIIVQTNGNLYRKYAIDYINTTENSTNNYEKIKVNKITEYNSLQEAANPVVFDYEKSEVSGMMVNNFISNDNNQIVGDFDGDGALDFLKYYDAHQDCLQWQTQSIFTPITTCISSILRPGGVYYFNNFLGQSNKQFLSADYTRFSSTDFNNAKAISFIQTNGQLSTKQGIILTKKVLNSTTNKNDIEFQIHSLANNNELKYHYNKSLSNILYDRTGTITEYDPNEGANIRKVSKTILEDTKELDINGDGISELLLIFKTNTTQTILTSLKNATTDINKFNEFANIVDPNNGGNPPVTSLSYEYILVNLLPSITNQDSFSKLNLDNTKNIFKESFISNFSGDGKSEILIFDSQDIPQLIKFNKDPNSINYITNQTTFKVINGYPTINVFTGIKAGTILGDFNGDGKTDLFSPIQINTNRSHIYYSTGKGFIQEWQGFSDVPVYNPGLRIIDGSVQTGPFTSSATQHRYRDNVYAIDLDKDGKSEIVSSSYHAYRIVDRAGDYTEYKITISKNIGVKIDANEIFTKVYENSFREENFYDYSELLGDFRLNQINNQIAIVGRDILNSNGTTKAFSFFNTPKRNRINKITQAGLATEIEYKELDPISTPGFYSPIKKENFPYAELERLPQSFVVSQLRQAGKKQDFIYNGFISNFTGRGNIGFRKVARTSWYASGYEQTKVWSGIEIDPINNGLSINEWSSRIEPFPSNISLTNSSLLSLKQINYLIQKLPSGVEINLPKTITTKDFITDVTTSNTINYDLFYSIKDNTINVNNGFSVTKSEFDYYNNSSGVGNLYCIGRPIKSTTTKTAYGDTKVLKEDYNFQNNLLQSVKKYDLNGNSSILEEYTYDSLGNRISVKNSNSIDNQTSTSSVEYDSNGLFIIKSIDNLGLITQFNAYNAYGQVLTQKDTFLNTQTNTYDNWGKILTTTNNLDGTTSYSYQIGNGNDRIVTQTEPSGNVTTSYTNVKGEQYLASTFGFTQGSTIYKKVEFDALSRVVKESESYFTNDTPKWNTISYDDSVFPSKITTTSYTGKVIETATDGRVMTNKESNGYSRVFQKTADPIGNIISSNDKGGVIKYTYNALGQNTASTYDQNNITTTYDTWGRKNTFTDPSNGTYQYEYNGFGAIKKIVSPKGYKEYIYNALGQLEKQNEISNDGSSTIKNSTYAYNNKGQLISKIGISNGKNYSHTLDYDATGRVKAVTETSNNRVYLQKNITYDSKNRIQYYTKELVSSGITTTANIENVYSAYDGTLYQVKNRTTGTILWQLNELKANGQVAKERLGNIYIQNTYAQNDLLSNITHGNLPSTSSATLLPDVLGTTYNFDAIKGELTSRKRAGNIVIDENFVYDDNNRLTTWTNPKTGLNFTNTYDEKGRITKNDQVGDITFNTSKIYQPIKIVLNTTGATNYEYISPTNHKVTQIITYNENNDPIFVDGIKGDVRFEYGLSKARQMVTYGGNFASTDKGKFTKFYNENHDFEVTVDNATGKEKHIIYIEGNPYDSNIVFVKNYTDTAAKYVFLHKDYLGSILAITDTNGVVLESRHFDAWGNFTHLKIGNGQTITNSTTIAKTSLLIDRGYTGHEYYADVNIIHMNGRLYDPLLRRFLNADENIQDPYNTQNYNKYGYVMNNPLMYNDPSGESYSGGVENNPSSGWNSNMDDRELANLIKSLGGAWDNLGIKDWINGSASRSVKEAGNFLSNNFKSIANFVDRNVTSLGQSIGNLFGMNSDTPASSYVPTNVKMQVIAGTMLSVQTGNTNGYYQIGQIDWTRVLGGAQMVGGVFEAVVGGVGGIVTAETGVGAAAGYAMFMNGLDNTVAGARTMWSGENTQTMLHQGVYNSATALGASQGTAESIATGADVSTILLGNGAAIKNAYTGIKSLKAVKGGMTELQLVTKASQKAEAAIGGSGGVAGTLKHTYAKNLLSRYQSMYGGDLNLGSNYFNNEALLGAGNKGFLDVVNHSTKTIYDFKFGNAFMSNSQYLKYSNNFRGYGIQIIKP